MLAWAPADLFTPVMNAITFRVKGVMSYFAEHLLVLMIVLVVTFACIIWAGSRKS